MELTEFIYNHLTKYEILSTQHSLYLITDKFKYDLCCYIHFTSSEIGVNETAMLLLNTSCCQYSFAPHHGNKFILAKQVHSG